MNVLIIDDDPNIHLECEMILKDFGIDSIFTAENLDEGKNEINNSNPDIIFLDVFLGKQNGLDLLDFAQENDIPTIVITGNPHEKLSFLNEWPVVKSFITKPINIVKFKYEFRKVIDYLADKESNTFLYYKKSNKIERILFTEVLYLETEGNYTTIVSKRKKHVLKKSLKQVKSRLSSRVFYQIFRNIVVNINHITSIDFTNNNVTVIHKYKLPLGSKFKNSLKSIIEEKFDVF